MKMVYVPLYQNEIDALVRFSDRKDRDPRKQAARFVREGLIRAGVLTDERSDAAAAAAAALQDAAWAKMSELFVHRGSDPAGDEDSA